MTYARKLSSSNTINRAYLTSDCALNKALDLISPRWTTQVLYLISFGENRFSLLKKKLPGISDQILGMRINHLLENKLITRDEEAEEKIYTITDKAKKLIEVLNQLADWHGSKKCL